MSWTAPKNSQILAVHAALLPTGSEGEVLMLGGDEHNQAAVNDPNGYKKTRVYDIASHELVAVSIPSPDTDVFCSGHAFTADGRLIIVGGTSAWTGNPDAHDHGLDFLGHKRCWLYNPRQREWTEAREMLPEPGRTVGGGRWYPGVVSLGNGDVMAFFGHVTIDDYRHRNTTPERYNVFGNSWTHYPQMCAPLEPEDGNRYLMYSRVFQLPDGNLFFATGMPVNYTPSADGDYFSTRYDPNTGSYIGTQITEPAGYGNGWTFPCVMLPLLPEDNYRPKLLFCGRDVAKTIDLSGPVDAANSWANTTNNPPLGIVRDNCCAVILPTGKVCVIGGVSSAVSNDGNQSNDSVHAPEIYDPGINWTTKQYAAGTDSWSADAMDTPQVARNYHSTALLLPNGKVFSAGGNKDADSGNPDSVGEKTFELYQPAYPAGTRPVISNAPKSISYGQSFRIETAQAASVQRVALIRNGSCTHAYDFDQRYVGLTFTFNAGDNFVTATAPPHGNVAPPGYYMLWIIDSAGRPCQLARFVRVTSQGCYLVTDRSSFSSVEISAMLANSATANFSHAFYAVFDGFLPDEIGVPGSDPVVSFHFDSTSGPSPSGISISGAPAPEFESSPGPDIPRRFTWRFNLQFTNDNDFSFMTETRLVYIKVSKGGHTCTGKITLIKQANPFMLDGATSWLSTDLRVFQVEEGDNAPFVSSVQHNSTPQQFIEQLLNYYNDPVRRNDPANPFHQISQDQNQSRLELSRMVNGRRIYNYAIAKVHFISSTLNAENVRVFFRMFNTAGTAMNYDYSPGASSAAQNNISYRRSSGASPISLLGFEGGEISSIPFFARARINSGSVSMTTQPDDLNVKTLNANSGNEFIAYFGCWLDINQTDPQFPYSNQGDGPFVAPVIRRSIQQLIRGVHQCLVAEVHFDPDNDGYGLIYINDTPGNSDKLSQRNLAIVESDNPGTPETHTIQHTFEIKASRSIPQFHHANFDNVMSSAAKNERYGPDEILIHWDTVPRDSILTLYIPSVPADEILQLAMLTRSSKHALEKVDDYTIRCLAGDINFIPIPAREGNIPGLLSIRLPDNVVKGQEFNLLVQQSEGSSRQIIGSFRVKIPVGVAADLLPMFARQLSVLRYIAQTIPMNNRWYPIFGRYLGHLGEKVRGLGGNPDIIEGSPDGDGKAPVPGTHHDDVRDNCNCMLFYWWVILATMLFFVIPATAVASTAAATSIMATLLVLILAGVYMLVYRCRGCRCRSLSALLTGTALAAGILGVSVLSGASAPLIVTMLALSGIGTALLAVIAVMRKCFCPKD